MKKTLYFLMMAFVLGLAACGDKKDGDHSEDDMDQLTVTEMTDNLA